MPKNTSFHDYIMYALFGETPNITSKTMFGGWGIYKNGVIFAIIAEGELYCKVSNKNQPVFEKIEGSHPFSYSRKNNKAITMSYWSIPEEIMEDRERFQNLINQSVAISRETLK